MSKYLITPLRRCRELALAQFPRRLGLCHSYKPLGQGRLPSCVRTYIAFTAFQGVLILAFALRSEGEARKVGHGARRS